jgi:hypothetical protein
MGEVLLAPPPPGSSNLPAVLRLCGKLDLLDQVGVDKGEGAVVRFSWH